jgi:hypothetical protein
VERSRKKCATQMLDGVMSVGGADHGFAGAEDPGHSHVETLFCGIRVAHVCLSTCGVTSRPSPAISRAPVQTRRSCDAAEIGKLPAQIDSLQSEARSEIVSVPKLLDSRRAA